MDSYDDLLNKAYAELPDKAKSHDERFEIPVLDSIQQGTKTIVKNFASFCEKIRREPQYVAKFMSREFAVPTSLEGSSLILHSKFNTKIINEKLQKYVKKYVVCPECFKPDTKILEQDRIKLLVCGACGARTSIR